MSTPLVARARYFLLVPILALAFCIAYIPHRDYVYPVHLDEWQVLAFTNELMEQGSTAHLTNPIYGGAQLTWNQTGELGTHVFWGAFKEVTGIDWLVIFRYFPGVVYMITVLGVFVMADRQGFGWQAAFFASLLPTTVGILGPAFLVPISLAMLFIPLALFAAFHLRGWWSYPLLSLLVVSPAAIHPPTAALLVVVLFPYMLFSLKGSPKRSLGMALAVGLPFVALFPAIYQIAVPMVKRLLEPQAINPFVDLPQLIPTIGYVTVLLGLLGVTYLAWKGKNADYGLVLGTMALLGTLAVFFSLHYGVDVVYQRGLQMGMLMVSILAGAGLMAVRMAPPLGNQTLRGVAASIGQVVAFALIAATIVETVPSRLDIPYYHMIDTKDYYAFTWIRHNLGNPSEKALLDPWQGMAFAGLAGRAVFSLTGETPDGNANTAYEFLDSGCVDSVLLTKNGLSIVYTPGPVDNAGLIEVREWVYISTDTH